MTMELSMTIALRAALTIGEVFTTLVITTFALVAPGERIAERIAVRFVSLTASPPSAADT
jgi:hypothetical protein